MARTQYFNIKFPFTANNNNGFFLDLNEDIGDKVASEIAHVVLTPKRTRIRMPDFGTDLIKFIFEPNDTAVWEDIEEEIKNSVNKYVEGVTILKVDVLKNINEDEEEDEENIILDIKYNINKGIRSENNRLLLKI